MKFSLIYVPLDVPICARDQKTSEKKTMFTLEKKNVFSIPALNSYYRWEKKSHNNNKKISQSKCVK